MNLTDALDALRQGEGQNTEFKAEITSESARDAVALLNTSGGKIFFGVDDKGNLVGVGKKTDARKHIEEKVIQPIVPKPEFQVEEFVIDSKKIAVLSLVKNKKIYSYKNVAYVRVGSMSMPLGIEEVVYRAAESVFIHFDSMACRDASLDDVSEELVGRYFKVRERVRGVEHLEYCPENLRKIKAVKEEKGKVIPTNAGILFFCKDPQKYYPHAKLRVEFFGDELMLESGKKYELEGPIPELADRAFEILERETPSEFITVRTKREERKKFPLMPLREAIINALVHRNYFIPSEVLVLIFPNRIEVRNPGSFPPGVTPEKPLHVPRNPLLAQYMYDLGYTEKYGIGITRMREFCKLNGYPDPEFILEESFTRVIFTTLPQKVKAFEKELSEKEIELLGYLMRGKYSSSQLASLIGMSKVSVLKMLKKLKELGAVMDEGRGKNKRYFA
jgi:ATP-dependent DNA helicase RecG